MRQSVEFECRRARESEREGDKLRTLAPGAG